MRQYAEPTIGNFTTLLSVVFYFCILQTANQLAKHCNRGSSTARKFASHVNPKFCPVGWKDRREGRRCTMTCIELFDIT